MSPHATDGPLAPNASVQHLTVIERIGAGTFGTVYKVLDEHLRCVRALKVLQPHLARGHRQRLIAEGRALARVDDEHVVRVLQVIDTAPVTGLVLEYVDGPDLAAFLDQEGGPARQIPIPAVREIGAGIIRGVMAVHESKHLHRDLKPENVLIARRRDGGIVPKVVDFGLARDLHATLSPGRTLQGQAMGTPLYMAPEQWRDAATVDERADVWSIGAILYEMATGVPPFPGQNPAEVMNQVLGGPLVPPRQLRPELPDHMERAILEALRRDRGRRTSRCGRLLEAWLDESQHTVVREPPPDAAGAPRWLDEVLPTEVVSVPRHDLGGEDPTVHLAPWSSLDPVEMPTAILTPREAPSRRPPVSSWWSERWRAVVDDEHFVPKAIGAAVGLAVGQLGLAWAVYTLFG